MNEIMRFEDVEKRILTIRSQHVLLDRDVAELYGVETKEVNQAVSRNTDKFPAGYMITLTSSEKTFVVTNCDRNSGALKMSRVLPTAFTEKGLYMLATILKSPTATQTTIAIVETFTKIRELSRVINQIPDIHEEVKQKSLMQRSGEILSEILDNNNLEVTEDETSIELNLALMKVKHITKRKKRE